MVKRHIVGKDAKQLSGGMVALQQMVQRWLNMYDGKMNSDFRFLSYTNINLQWIIDLGTKEKTIKHSDENLEENL